MKVIYVITMAIACISSFNGSTPWYYLKILIALFWTFLWVVDILRVDGRIKAKDVFCLREYMFPPILVALWSVFVWFIAPPAEYDNSYFMRMVSNSTLLIVAVTNAIAARYFFGKKAINLTCYALILGILANLFVVIQKRGLSLFIEYLPTPLIGDYSFGSELWALAGELEVQGPTIAIGIFLIYFVFGEKSLSKKQRIGWLGILLICLYLGFKRTSLFALAMVFCVSLLIKSGKFEFKGLVKAAGIVYVVVSFCYIIIVKTSVLNVIASSLGLDTMGRDFIYAQLNKYYEISPFFIGNGFTYVTKHLYEKTGFVAHSEIIRMYAEIGCIPFILWMYHYLVRIVNKITLAKGKEVGKMVFLITVYVFSTYYMENMLLAYAVQYSYLLIPICLLDDEKFSTKIKVLL